MCVKLWAQSKAKKSQVRIVLTNHKGGVGKSTLAASIAVTSATLGYKTLAVDLDIQGHSTALCGVPPVDLEYTSLHVLLGDCSLDDAIVESPHSENLFVLGNALTAERLARLLETEQSKRDLRLKMALDSTDFDVVVIDCQPELNTRAVNGVVASTYVVCPVMLEPMALVGLSSVRTFVRNLEKQIDMVVLVFVDERLRLSRLIRQELQLLEHEKLCSVTIPRSVRVPELSWKGIPPALVPEKHPVCEAYYEASKVILDDAFKKGC